MKKYLFVVMLSLGMSVLAVNPEPVNCTELLAVNFENKTIEGFVPAQIDKRNKVLMVAKRLKTAAVSTVYKGTKQNVYIVLNTLQETDGESTYRVSINGKQIGDEVVNTRIYNAGIKEYTVEKHRLNTKKICLKKGDVIQVTFTNATNGFVPEGNLTATARGRWKSLELCK